jgi:hypothetical protein
MPTYHKEIYQAYQMIMPILNWLQPEKKNTEVLQLTFTVVFIR